MPVSFDIAPRYTVNIQQEPMTTHDVEDKEYIRRSQKDASHFEALYNKYYKQILKFIYKRMNSPEDAYEVTSTTFSKALFNIKKYKDQGHPFTSWLYRIALNEIAQFYRNSEKSRAICIDDHSIRNLADETETEKEELLQLLSSSLKILKNEELELIELRFFEGRSFNEIGLILGITENNSKVRTYRVLDKLKSILKKLTTH